MIRFRLLAQPRKVLVMEMSAVGIDQSDRKSKIKQLIINWMCKKGQGLLRIRQSNQVKRKNFCTNSNIAKRESLSMLT